MRVVGQPRNECPAQVGMGEIRGATEGVGGRVPLLRQLLAAHRRHTGGILGGLLRPRLGKFG